MALTWKVVRSTYATLAADLNTLAQDDFDVYQILLEKEDLYTVIAHKVTPSGSARTSAREAVRRAGDRAKRRMGGYAKRT
ncbi:MAG TPA: hypothetical protein VGW35_09065 [Methylomirabilota bacterium]|nr:hypothetical protein [Methylomirabilota bacterium]